MPFRPLLAAAAALTLAAAAAPAHATDTVGRTTAEQRIAGAQRAPGAFSFLRPAPGQGYAVRQDGVGTARDGREQRRRSLLYFAQLSDFQLADEESPARVEATDPLELIFTAAWRPQEAIMPWVVDASVRQVNAFAQRSPVRQGDGSGAGMALALTTGDNADNNQRNEAEWVARLLEGGRLDPNSGSSDPADYAACPPGTPGPEEAARYTGVQDYDDYAESAQFYDPDQPAGPYASWPAYPGLMDRAQRPFDATGLKVPSYIVLGNHDSLVQGNEDATAAIEAVAGGCAKSITPSQRAADPLAGLTASTLTSDPSKAFLVPPDRRRRFLTKAEYRRIFASGAQKDAHGFAFVDPEQARASNGAASYYSWTPRPGLRLVALDTVSEGGQAGPSADGNLDDPQFRWLTALLDRAEQADELVILLSHHGPTSLTSTVPDELAQACSTSDPEAHDPNPGCDRDPRDSRPIHLGDDMLDLALEHPHVIGWVAGHSHINDVESHARKAGGGFWVIRTSAEADWPHQDRLIEVMDNQDGTLSLFGTLIDGAGPVEAPPAGTPAAGLDANQLASVARTLGYNDTQAGGGTGEGTDLDHNVELLVQDPRRTAPNIAPGRKKPKLKVAVRPRRVRAMRRTRFRFRVTLDGRPVRGARITLGRGRARTGRRGRAAIRLRIVHRGPARVRAGKTGYRRAVARIRVLPRR
ncbi:MAG TPA: hypothetical protein VF533_21305 [Solirubrobacteraceae bacterium]